MSSHPLRGKWSQPGVPHSGWRCIGVDDSGVRYGTCDMCEVTSIRYVHYMTHPDYPGGLGCGCVCAGAMENNPVRAKRRETMLKSWARVQWRTSTKGNYWTKYRGMFVTIFRSGARWGVVVDGKFADTKYPNPEQAKTAAFALIPGHIE